MIQNFTKPANVVVVAGHAETADMGAGFNLSRDSDGDVSVWFGSEKKPRAGYSQYVTAADLRELATLFNALADALDAE